MKPASPIRNRFLLAGDLVLIVTSVLASFALRLDLGPAFVYFMPQAWLMVAVALVVKPTIYYFFGLYRRYWVYASVRELRLIAVATAAAQVVVALLLMLAIVTSRPAGDLPALGDLHRLAVLALQRRRSAPDRAPDRRERPGQPEKRRPRGHAPGVSRRRGRRRRAGRARDAAQPAAAHAAGGLRRRRPGEAAQGHPRRACGRPAARPVVGHRPLARPRGRHRHPLGARATSCVW